MIEIVITLSDDLATPGANATHDDLVRWTLYARTFAADVSMYNTNVPMQIGPIDVRAASVEGTRVRVLGAESDAQRDLIERAKSVHRGSTVAVAG